MIEEERRWIRQILDNGLFLLVVRLTVAGVFIVLGTKKIIAEPQDFLKAVKEYDLVPLHPPQLINATAVILPWVELAIGVALALGIFLRGAALTFMAMLLVFTAAVFIRALGVYQAEDIAFCAIQFDCGCGQGEVIICDKLGQNGILFLLGIPILLTRTRKFCLEGRRTSTD